MKRNRKRLLVLLATTVTLCLGAWGLFPVEDGAWADHRPGHSRGGGQGGGGNGDDDTENGDEAPKLPGLRYRFEFLGTFGGDFSTATDINNHGEVVGWATDADGRGHAFLSTPESRATGEGLIYLHDLLTDDAQEIWIRLRNARAINDASQILAQGSRWSDDGESWVGTILLTPGFWDDEAGEDVPPVIQEFMYPADAINVHGDASGGVATDEGGRAFFLPSGGDIEILGVLHDSHDFSSGTAINSFADVVGRSGESTGQVLAFVYHPDTGMQALDMIFNHQRAHSSAVDINDLGEIVGRAAARRDGRNFRNHAVRWRNGIIEDLGTLGGNTSWAGSINNYGFIVGQSYNAEGELGGFLYHDDFGMVALEDLVAEGLPSGVPVANFNSITINDYGEIVGTSNIGMRQAFLLTPLDSGQ